MNKKRKSEANRRWAEIKRIEPALATLEHHIRQVKDAGGPYFCANDHWYGYTEKGPAGRGGFRRLLIGLVGDECGVLELKNSADYDLAYDRLYDLLPDCRNCGCA